MSEEPSDLASASRALKDATTALTRALGQAFADVGSQASREIADELRDAAKELNNVATMAGHGYRASQRSQKAERTRTDLLAAAARVFAEQGYEGASVGDIAKAAGYTKGAVYAHFSSKQEMLMALAREMIAQDASAVASETDLHEFFGVCPQDEGNQPTLLGLELYLYAIRHPESREDLAPILAQTQTGVEALIHRARSSEDADDDIINQEDKDIAFALVALHTYGSITAALSPGEDGHKETAAMVARLIDHLLTIRSLYPVSMTVLTRTR